MTVCIPFSFFLLPTPVGLVPHSEVDTKRRRNKTKGERKRKGKECRGK